MTEVVNRGSERDSEREVVTEIGSEKIVNRGSK